MEVLELRYRRLFETAQDGILILDAKTGKIFDANPFLLNIIGYSLKELINKELWEIGLFYNIEKAKIIFEELKNKGYARYEHIPLLNKNKKIVQVEFICNSYLVDGKNITQCNIRDIGKRIKTEQLLVKHNEAVNKLNKMMMGREIKMIDLKKEIENLKEINEKLRKKILEVI